MYDPAGVVFVIAGMEGLEICEPAGVKIFKNPYPWLREISSEKF
jgi:hypothetical protein